jgi:rhamnose transport system permease protein
MNGFARRYRWELFVAGMVVLAGVWATLLSPYYLNLGQLFYASGSFVFTGILGFGLMTIIVTGEIDLSIPSTLAVCTVLLAKFSALNLPLWLAVPCIFAVAGILGAVNGLLVARLRLPALAVTLGTMGAYRGLAFIIGSEVGYTGFNDTYLWLGTAAIGKIQVPVQLLVFFAAAMVFIILMHFSTFGRRCYAVGNNMRAVEYSGIRVARVKMVAYVIGGLTAALGAWIFIGQYGSARGDNANGVILGVITSVVLGGVDINGGSGTVAGVILSILFLWTLRNGMGLANITGEVQELIIGVLLIASILISNLSRTGLARGKRQKGKPKVVDLASDV